MSKSNLIYASLRYGFCFGNELLVCEFATSCVSRLGKLRFLGSAQAFRHYAFLASFGLKAKFSFACHHLANSKLYSRKINYR